MVCEVMSRGLTCQVLCDVMSRVVNKDDMIDDGRKLSADTYPTILRFLSSGAAPLEPLLKGRRGLSSS